ncbi:MAG: hypothetical protein EBX89_06600 [Actinobacteria bacterium]|nr:hypothetical protein [Actinomycetota bacterium]
MSKEINSSTLRRYNLIAGVFHLAQMLVVLALANDFSLPIVARYMSGPPGTTFAEALTLFDTPVGLAVAIFLGLSAAPAFVYGIVISLFVLFNTFAIVQYLQYKKVGKWKDYIRGEKTYITLSLIAKSALAWQIFASTLVS